MSENSSIYTFYANSEYKELINILLQIIVILVVFHLLMSNQKSIGLVGGMFNSTFSDTFAKLLISVSFYYLIFKKIINII